MSDPQIGELAQRLLGKHVQALEPEEMRVLAGIHKRLPISRHAAELADESATFGERLSDRVAAIGGSWRFIISFALVLLSWILLNTSILSHFGLEFDLYPYIFLNLMLSTLAAIQAPVIMMSRTAKPLRTGWLPAWTMKSTFARSLRF